MSSLLALVRYRNSGAFSVEAKVYGFWLRRKHPNFLIARGVPPCLGPWGWGENSGRLRSPWRLGTAWSLALGVRVGVGPSVNLQNIPYLE